MAIPASEMFGEVEVYRRARGALEREGVPYMVVGGQAVACYGHRRPTKDIDFLILKEDAETAVRALERAKFFIRRSDPRWIFQAVCGDVLVDLIFASCTPRGVVPVTRDWLAHARDAAIAGDTYPVSAPEELIGLKILAQHENRSDWWDAEMILERHRDGLDWERITRISAIDPVKTLAFLLFLETRHPGEAWYPPGVLRRFWGEAAAELPVDLPIARAGAMA
ncbi:MAG: nucleotidyltransferase [Armatimonadetes bacterium]|nr:nucleotidyltransferase [Armatimonadota bacterium]